MTDSDQIRLLAAQAIARDAGALARSYFQDRASLQVCFKGRQEHVTVVDRTVEALIIDRLKGVFPNDQFLGEESGGSGRDNVWIIDPIDGTANYVHGISHFCVSIAYVSSNIVRVGVIYAPMTDELFSAVAGSGAWLNGKRIQVSTVADLAASYIEIGWNLKDRVAEFCSTIERAASQGAAIIRAGSAALGLAHVAMGRLDGYCEQHVYTWDVAAGILLVAEAGGKTNAFLNSSTMTSGNAILATNSLIFEALSKVSRIS
jgi:myo-inositol-1(or 4)-monophosphatase